MKNKFSKIPISYFYIFFVLLIIVSILYILYVKKNNYENQYKSPLLSDNGNFNISVINNNEIKKICDIKIFIDKIKLIQSDFYYDGSNHNYTFYKFNIESGKCLINIHSDSLEYTSTDSINFSDVFWVTVSITDSMRIDFFTEEIIFI